MEWAEVDHKGESSEVLKLKLISAKSRGANSITFHFLLQALSLMSLAT